MYAPTGVGSRISRGRRGVTPWSTLSVDTILMPLQGRDVIEVAGDARRLFETAHKISAIDLTVTMRRALEVFREHAAAVVIEWIFDIMQVHIGGQGQILQELVAAELFAPRKPDKPLHPDILAAYPEAENGTRLDWLFLYHPRLWKRPRLNLKQIYVTILTLSHEHRLTVGEFIASLFKGSLTILQPSVMPTSFTALSTPISSSTAKPKPPSNSLP